ncbi:hypothetical protein HY732_00460 [Candidatus Uhrbacteria bacterium]|nr:hypothetical protein [Candidatus Uhrbacteria bacterium]
MDKVYVCTQCGEESDAPGSCQICGLALVPMQDNDADDDAALLDDDISGVDDDSETDLSLEAEQEEEDSGAYDSYDDEDNV